MTQDIDIGKLSEQINDKADKDLWNTVPNVWNNTLNTSQITNCITEIPQDIKLELNNGTLTLKAGSKVYVPNGVGVFDEVVISSDLTHTTTANGVLMLVATKSNLSPFYVSKCFSGSTAPTTSSSGYLWYDTTNNKLKVFNGTTWDERGDSLPIAIVTANGTSYTSIDQVFNGFSYIGSTIFALPGVKGLIPNGRNEDGSLKNIEFTTSVVRTTTLSGTAYENIRLDSTYLGTSKFPYDEATNLNYNTTISSGNERYNVNAGSLYKNNGRITSFTSKTTFHAVDSNDSSWIAQQAMPSNRYIDLTLGASGSTYTAPANGWVEFAKSSNAANQYVSLEGRLGFRCYVPSTATNAVLSMPVRKGEVFTAYYDCGGTLNRFRFYYAEGEN